MRIIKVFLLLIAVLCIALVAHIATLGWQKSTQAFYPLEADMAQKGLKCSNDSPQWLSDISAYVVSEYGTLATQLAYVDKNGLLSWCTSGWVGLPLLSSKVKTDNRFRVASVTKLVTAEAVLELVRQNSLTLDTTLGSVFSEFLPFSDPRIATITIRQLLNHSAGFDRLTGVDEMMDTSDPWCPSDLERLQTLTLAFEPGTKKIYSNLGYCLLGAIIAKTTNTPYQQYIKNKYSSNAHPFDFATSNFLQNEVKPDLRFDSHYNPRFLKELNYLAIESSAGMVISALGLAKLMRVFVDRDDLSLLSVSEDQDCNIYKFNSCYGFAFYQYKTRGTDTIFYIHSGYLPGSTAFVVVTKNKEVFVFLGAGRNKNIFSGKTLFYKFVLDRLDG